MARKYFNDLIKSVPLPDLIEIQTASYQWLFNEGLQELLDEINPVDDFTGNAMRLEFGEYTLEKPKITEEYARNKNLTYKAPLRCRVKLINKITNKTKETDVFLGEFPIMTPKGTFIINGIERVVVSQLVRSFGVLFVDMGILGKNYFVAKIIPTRGSWLEFETSNRDVISVKIDRKRKIPVTTLLRALGIKDDTAIKAAFADVDTNEEHKFIESTLAKDPAQTQEEAFVEIYKRIRPGDLVTEDSAKSFFESMFFNPKRYDLGKVGRYKMNQRLNITTDYSTKNRILRLEDVIEILKELIRMNNDEKATADDIDHLKNRRVKAVGELVQSRLRVGLLRMERIIKDRMSVIDPATVTPAQLINSRPIVAVLQEFFASSQLSHFMLQTNPLAELEHKRCLSATGPGGLTRERAGFEVRDVHTSHYGRICPIETPEGPNIGLVGYLATYAKINEFGFIETPFFKIKQTASGAKVTDEIEYLDAAEEERYYIAPASTDVDKNMYIVGKQILARKCGEPVEVSISEVSYIDVSPRQTVSISTALIPFIEHDDAARANMASNMQKQAVPLVKPEAPIVGTGMEVAALASGQVLISPANGTIKYVDSSKIVLATKQEDLEFKLDKYIRSNQATCINQRPSVIDGQKIKKGDLLADSSATENGELALGQNFTVAFMSWGGANYEDAIILSERILKDDRLTSIHIEKYTIEVRDTKLGPELITRDIPNVGEEALSNLDEQGIVRIGAEINAGDILVGKISPKGETELSAEEKLLRAIFGEKAKDVKDTSLRLPHGERGKVVDIKIFSKDAGDELAAGVYQMIEVSIAQMRRISVGDKLAGRHGNKGVISKILPEEDMPYLPNGKPVDIILNPLGVISRMNLGQILETHLGWAAKKNNEQVATPVFKGVKVSQIEEELKKSGFAKDGKVQLFDGKSGRPYEQRTVVGEIYIMKLIHLVDDKMHARSTGPYSMVTQQPLGGKAQFGGQRFGEMEVWALEAYGAAHILQEMLTIKSDDVVGRSKAYEAIIKDEEIQKPSIPAAFHVLVRELQSLGLDIELINQKVEEDEPISNNSPVIPEPEIVNDIEESTNDDNEENETNEDQIEDELVTELYSNQEKEPSVTPEEEVIAEEE